MISILETCDQNSSRSSSLLMLNSQKFVKIIKKNNLLSSGSSKSLGDGTHKRTKRRSLTSTAKRNAAEYYTVTGHYSKTNAKSYEQIGTFLTQYKIRENYKFLQMISVPRLDPAVPKPEGGVSVPACGEPLLVPASFPQSIEAAIHKFANASSKATSISILDHSGKPVSSITYVKLLSRVQRVAYHLLNKLVLSNVSGGEDNEIALKQGDRVALVFPNNDPIGFTVAFCGCLMAGLVALPIDVPLVRRDAGSQNLGFLLGQVGASVVLTSELCYKALPKSPNTEMIEFKGWPKVPWIVLEHLSKSPPKEWSPPNRIASDSIAYIEVNSIFFL
jgi:hypothetical protein